jgi:hypothetical protein
MAAASARRDNSIVKVDGSAHAARASQPENGIADGANVCHPLGWSGGTCAPPFHGTSVEALRPACAS